jgi:hypothetical protein
MALHLPAIAIIVMARITNARSGFLMDEPMAKTRISLFPWASLTLSKRDADGPASGRSFGKSLRTRFAALWVAALVSACGANIEANYPDGTDGERDDTGSFLDLFSFGTSADEKSDAPKAKKPALGIAVNTDLWRASLDTLRFMPIASADPLGGVIITDWYNDPGTKDERLKINVVISGLELRADALRVSIFRERQVSGRWTSIAVSSRSATQMENIILTRARDFKVARRDNP